jgi:hypothetical protein
MLENPGNGSIGFYSYPTIVFVRSGQQRTFIMRKVYHFVFGKQSWQASFLHGIEGGPAGGVHVLAMTTDHDTKSMSH